MFCEENSLGKNHALYVHLRCKDAEPFPERVGPRIMLLESLPNKQSSGSFSLDKKWDMYEFKQWKHWQKPLSNNDWLRNKLWHWDEYQESSQTELRRRGKHIPILFFFVLFVFIGFNCLICKRHNLILEYEAWLYPPRNVCEHSPGFSTGWISVHGKKVSTHIP